MINHKYLELFNQSSIKKDIDIAYNDSHITNDDVVSGSFSLNESAFATKELRFGSLVSSQMSVKLFNTVPNLMNKELDVSMVVDNIVSNPLKIGKFKVLEDKPTTDRLYKQIKAYDALYEVINKNVVDWYESLSFPLEQKAFRDSFFDYIGITQVDITLVNDDMLIERTITANTISGQQVLSAICELNGAIGRMNRDGKFEYVILDANPTSRITIDNIASKSGSYEDFDCQPISKVQIRQTTDDIGAIVGEEGNTYIMQDNFLVYGKSSADLTTIATNLLSVVEGISYTPFNIKAIYGNPCYEIGDAITVVTKNKTFNSYIFNRTLKGIQAMTDNIKADGVEYYTENLNSTNTQIQQLARQTNELSRTVEETKSTITSIEVVAKEANQNAQTALDNVGEAYDKATEALGLVGGFDERITKNESSITQNAKEIELKVSVGDVSSQLSVESEQVTISGNRLVVDADNFKLNANGSVKANSGEFSGDIIADGKITIQNKVLNLITELKTESRNDLVYSEYFWEMGSLSGSSATAQNIPTFIITNNQAIFIDEVHSEYGYFKKLYSPKLQGKSIYGEHAYISEIDAYAIKTTDEIQSNSLKISNNGSSIKFIRSGSTVLVVQSTTSIQILTLDTIRSWYPGVDPLKTSILVNNGDAVTNPTHIDDCCWSSSDNSWYATFDRQTGGYLRINYTVICWE